MNQFNRKKGRSKMPRRNTRSNKGSGNRKGVDPEYLMDKYCPNPTPPKRSRPSPATPKPSAATTRTGRGGGDAGKSIKYFRST